MKKDMIFKELIQLDWEVKDQGEFFDKMVDKLYDLGFVKDTYKEAIKVREANYPTALPVEPYPVAIPHAEIQHLNKPFIACTRLKNPVDWCEMGTDDVIHPVKFVFMLGFMKSDEHIDLLQVLMENFQNPELMKQLLEAKTEEEYYNIVCGMEGMDI
ncbi:PTS sugar transporter subunit IIA [Pseudoflavonifractor sp. An85]|uniref:PTS sugar transporter subunit IIA n=1 Tax=Pseudoflavonifractor sp. An85 TaxID=1965661 RepID=UPI000B390C17|nr:PTS sugar transporter subunit IIA [Pseudoflavonifractor sp. An85]OUN25696.1 PTS sugar transporter subunit IIA [Pseudoflavonifractor sp. An85]